MEKVTIVIPTYNYGKYLPDAIKSCLHQTYPNIDIIVIDDGSTDNTHHIVKDYPVQYEYQPHAGVSSAMNHGVKLAKSELVMFLGADDLLDPRYVEKCVAEIEKDDKIGFIWTAARVFGLKNEILLPKKLNRFNVLLAGTGGQLGGALWRKKTICKIGMFDTRLPTLEDWELAIRAYMNGWKGVPIYEPLYFYRIHSSFQRNQQSESHRKSAEIINNRYPLRKIIDAIYQLLPEKIEKFLKSLI